MKTYKSPNEPHVQNAFDNELSYPTESKNNVQTFTQKDYEKIRFSIPPDLLQTKIPNIDKNDITTKFNEAFEKYLSATELLKKVRENTSLSLPEKEIYEKYYRQNIRDKNLPYHDIIIPFIGKKWLDNNMEDVEVTHVNYGNSIAGAITNSSQIIQKGYTKEQQNAMKDFLVNNPWGRKYAKMFQNAGYTPQEKIAELNMGKMIRSYDITDIAHETNELRKADKRLKATKHKDGFLTGITPNMQELVNSFMLIDFLGNIRDTNLIYKYMKDPNSLTPAERNIIEAKALTHQVESNADPNIGYKIGEEIKDVLMPSLIDLIPFGKVGKIIVSKYGGKLLNTAFKKLLAEKLIVTPSLKTAFSPSSQADTFREMQGRAAIDEDGNISFEDRKNIAEAYAHSHIYNTAAGAGDIAGDLLGKSKLFKWYPQEYKGKSKLIKELHQIGDPSKISGNILGKLSGDIISNAIWDSPDNTKHLSFPKKHTVNNKTQQWFNPEGVSIKTAPIPESQHIPATTETTTSQKPKYINKEITKPDIQPIEIQTNVSPVRINTSNNVEAEANTNNKQSYEKDILDNITDIATESNREKNKGKKRSKEAIYKQVLPIIKKTPYWDQIINDPQSSGLSAKEKALHALILTIEDNGQAINNKKVKRKWDKWINNFEDFTQKNDINEESIGKTVFSTFGEEQPSQQESDDQSYIDLLPEYIQNESIKTENAMAENIRKVKDGETSLMDFNRELLNTHFPNISSIYLLAGLLQKHKEYNTNPTT